MTDEEDALARAQRRALHLRCSVGDPDLQPDGLWRADVRGHDDIESYGIAPTYAEAIEAALDRVESLRSLRWPGQS